MNQMFNWLSTKVTALVLIAVFGLVNFASVEARLVFTTEGDGTLIDQDLDGDSNFSLFFGTSLGEEIEFDTANDRFNISNDIRVTGNAVTTGGVDIEGAAGLTLQNDETITNTTDGTIDINATNTDVSDNLNVGANATVVGTSDFQGNISDSLGDLTIDDNAVITGTTDVQGDVSSSTGDVTINDDLDVTGTSDLQGNVSNSTGNLTLDDAVDVTGALDVQGGDITLQNDETISNSTDGTVTIDATTTEVTGGFDVQGGDITLQNDETISNSTDGTIDINAATTAISTDLTVGGTSSLDGNVTLNNDSQIINLRAENAATAGAPVCTDATDLGRIYYDTDTENLLFCKETSPGTFGWTSTASTAGSASNTFYAEFANFTVWADGTANRGTMRAEYDDTDDRSYYLWRTRRVATQDYDVVLQWQVPDNFNEFDSGATNHLQFDIETAGAAGAIDLRDVQVNGADQSISDTANTAATWATQDVDLSGATVSAGDTMTFRFTMFGDSVSTASLSNVKINYLQQ